MEMITTNDTKVKERSHEPEKLTMLTTNTTKVKGFKVKGKGAPKSDDIITTGNMAEYLERYKEEMKNIKKGKKK